MAHSTQPYKRSLSGSIGSGMKSIMGSNDRRFYVLEHKVSSQYHKAGESQRIIVDEIELGRDPKCQVRFDESFATVSRRHAAIVRDGDNWKLVQLSQVNSTYLNGHKVQKEWYLQSGDEIQLSTNGPKLGFIIPQGEKGLVKSIGLTARMNLFRQQALRPYKTAISILSVIFVLAIVGGVWALKSVINDNEALKGRIVKLDDKNKQDSIKYTQRFEEYERKLVQDSIEDAKRSEEDRKQFDIKIAENNRRWEKMLEDAKRESGRNGGNGIDALLKQQGIYKDIYYLYTEKVVSLKDGKETQIMQYIEENGKIKKYPYGWCGTGFLLDDGKFVTARHCIEGWLYDNPYDTTEISTCVRKVSSFEGYEIKAYFKAVSSISGQTFSFTNKDFTICHSLDKRAQIGTNEDGEALYWVFPFPFFDDWSEIMWSTDYAYTTKTNGQKGNLGKDVALSQNLLPMQQLVAIGFPQQLGVKDSKELLDPISTSITCSRQGLANNGCILHSAGTDHGNSGGPVLAVSGGELVVVGIVSRGEIRSKHFSWAVPISQIYK